MTDNETRRLFDETPEVTSLVPVEAERDLPAVDVNRLPAEQRQQVTTLMDKLDAQDTNSIMSFGVEAQRELTASADQMLERVRNKDVGPVGESLNDMMLHVRGLGIDDLNPGEKLSWFERNVLGKLHPVARFVQRYETIQSQIDRITSTLEGHKVQLIRDVTLLDKLFAASVNYFNQLELYILAGEAKLRELDQEVLPQLRARAEASGDMLDAQRLRDMASRRDDLERRVHDLRLTRQVTLQSLPQIRLIQDVDKSLVSKIQSSILTTIPVWKNQIALAITLWNQQKALETQRKVADTTNEMLRRNAELLRMGSAEARREVERGIFDIETVKKVNDELIQTIQESIQIAEEGRRKRVDAEQQMVVMENELKRSLVDADRARARLSSE